MNTSAFATAIRIKIQENQYKTYFFLFAFCLIIISVSLNRIMGNLISEQLEMERKKDFVKGIEMSFESRWKMHLSQIRSYAYWSEVWDLIKAKKEDKAYLNFQLDPSIDKQFDFFGIYLNPNEAFIIKWSDGSGEKHIPDEKIISYLYNLRSKKEGHSNHIVFFNNQYYLVSVTCLANNLGNPMIDGIMIFGYEMDNFISNTTAVFPIQMDIFEGDEIPLSDYDFINLEKYILPESKKLSLIYSPETLRITIIRPYIIGILGIFSVINLFLFAWILYKIKD